MHFLAIRDLSSTDIEQIFSIADSLRDSRANQSLGNRKGVLFFPESSIRTRTTFELGIKHFGGTSITFPSSSLDKKEDLKDVIGYIGNWADFVVVRHQDPSVLLKLTASSQIPIVNAMTSSGHPCEILSDLYSMRLRNRSYRDLTYTYVGPVCNTLHSWCEAATLLDFTLNHVSTETNNLKLESKNYRFTSDFDPVLADTDVILTDSLPKEYVNSEYLLQFQVTLELLEKFRKSVILNPCPPFCRGEEVSSDAVASSHFVGYDFKETLFEVQVAILIYCIEKK